MIREKLIDVDRDQLDLLHTILNRHIPNKTVWAYGSRVTWKAGETSDLDLAVFGCDSMEIYDLKEALDKSDLLISVDVMDWESIPDDFKENIRGKYVVLQEKSSQPASWREVKLGDVAEVTMGQSPKSDTYNEMGIGLPFYQGVVDFGDKYTTPRVFCSSPQKVIEAGDILLSVRAPVGEVNLTKGKCSIGRGNAGLRMKEGEQTFLFYLLKSAKFRFHSISSGSVFSSINKSNIENLVIFVPSSTEQQIIAEVLSSLDDKIDLLHRQNKTLENMAQIIFHSWFKKKPGESWDKRHLSHFGRIICGKTPSKKIHGYFGGNIPFIKIPDMHGKTFVFDTDDTLTESGKKSQDIKTLPPKSICVSCIATVGLVSMNVFECQTNQQINSIVPVKDEYRYYLYLFMKSSKNLLEAMASGGTATMNLNTGNFAKIMVPNANKKLIFEFDGNVKPLFKKIFFNQSQIRTLEKLRDLLLPKLMSGKMTVKH